MRILLVGQAAFAEQVMARLVGEGDEIAAVVCPPDRGSRVDPVKAAATAAGVPVHQFSSLKGADARAAFEGARADLVVLAYVTQIVPEPLLTRPRHTSICFHPSLLPRYRGGSAIAWQLIRGETTTGVSVFWPDAGIDTGPIVVQREAPIGPDDTAGSLYYQTLFPLGVDAMVEAVSLIRTGAAPRDVQDESRASYDPLLGDEHAGIAWQQASGQVHDLIRGCDPQPGAYTTWRGQQVRLYGPRRVEGSTRASPGTVLMLDDDGMTIATGDGAVRCARARGGDRKAAATDVATALRLSVGDMLG